MADYLEIPLHGRMEEDPPVVFQMEAGKRMPGHCDGRVWTYPEIPRGFVKEILTLRLFSGRLETSNRQVVS